MFYYPPLLFAKSTNKCEQNINVVMKQKGKCMCIILWSTKMCTQLFIVERYVHRNLKWKYGIPKYEKIE